LEEFRLESGLHPHRLHEILQARGIRGILLPPQREAPHWGNFPWDCYSVVRFGPSIRYPACHLVSSDQVGNAMRAFGMIRSKGYRRIGFLTNEAETVFRGGHLFEAGFLLAQRLVDEAERVPICVVTDTHSPAGVDKMVEWLEEQRVEAIFTDIAEMPALLDSLGLRVPEDIGLAVTNVADIAVPAGIHQHPMEIGKVGTLLLHSLITNNERGIPAIFRQVLVDGAWVDGASLPDRDPGK
jgi:LacI family transcriptional regulator